jgi:archaetidylinositol phosphate synthase
MTLDSLRPVADRLLVPFVRAADRLGVGPNAVSLVAFAVALGAGGAFAFVDTAPRLYLVGALAVVGNGWLDLLDGALARRQGIESSRGDLLDHVLDRYADIAIVVGLAAGIDAYALGLAAITGVLLTSYLGTQAQALGVGRAYGGLVGRADRLVAIAVVAVLAAFVDTTLWGYGPVAWLLGGLALVGHLTAVQRWYQIHRAL